jgi:subtilisin-like proprotein convertase family protein
MKKFYTLLVGIIFSFGINAQTVAITSGAGGAQGTSGNIIVGQSNYHVSESIYTQTEIGGNTAFTSAGTAINKIGYYVTAVGSPATVSTFKIWMKNVPLATTTLAAGTYSTTGYTLVYNGSFTPTNIYPTPNELLLTTSFTRTAGTNLEVLVERLDGVLNTGYVFLSANGNQTSSTITTARRYNGATAPTGASSLTASAFRPAIELIHVPPIDANAYDIIAPNVSCYGSLQNIGITIKNEGTTQIAAGAASVNFKIRGANSFTGTLTNTGAIAIGATGTVTFTGINLNNPGTNYDTAIVTITGDGNHSNDTLYTTSNTSPVLNTFPLVEDAETTPLPIFPYSSKIDLRQAWTLQTGAYSNGITTADSLVPRAPGTRFYLFDSYNASEGTQSRLYSKCIDAPSPNAGLSVSFWMSHDSAYPAYQDSMYVSVSTDKGVSWTRLKGYDRLDATATAYYWKKDSVILNGSYIGQTIQIGFEGSSHYGNAFGLDDINVYFISCTPTFNAITQTACNSYTWTNGTTYTTSGTYIYAHTGSGGCPVTDTLHLTINVGTVTSSTQTACDSYTWHGTTYTASGNYAYVYPTGCNVDSLYLIINTGTFNSTTQGACNSYSWHGTTYTASGNYTYSYYNNSGCASVDTLHLTINQVAPAFIVQPSSSTTVCGGGVNLYAHAGGNVQEFQWQVKTSAASPWTNVINGGEYSGASMDTLKINPVYDAMNGYLFRAVAKNCGATSVSDSAILFATKFSAAVTHSPDALSCGSSTPIELLEDPTVAFNSGELGLIIPDNGLTSGVNHTINVSGIPAGAIITGMKVKLNATHNWVGDIVAVLKAPNNKVLNLDYVLTGTGGYSYTNGLANTVFSSDGTAFIKTSTNSTLFTGTFKPDAYLPATEVPNNVVNNPVYTLTNIQSGPDGFIPDVTNFSNLYNVPNGPWTLAMYDYYADSVYYSEQPINTFDSWSLEITYSTAVRSYGIWSPATGLFTDSALTIPYLSGTLAHNVFAAPSASTNYSIVAQTPGCSSNPLVVPVIVYPSHFVSLAASANNVCSGASVSLSASGASTYSWTPGNLTGSTITVTPPINTNNPQQPKITAYKVVGTTNLGCVDSTSINITANTIRSIVNQPKNDTVTCSSSAFFSIKISGEYDSLIQWQEKITPSGNWTNLSNNAVYAGVNKSNLIISTVTDAMNGYQYRAYFTGSCAAAVYSNTATLLVNKLNAIVNPNQAVVCSGKSQKFEIQNISEPVKTRTFSSGTLHSSIPDGDYYNGILTNPIIVQNIPDTAEIMDVSIKFNLPHTRVGDILINLLSPNGQVLNLVGALSNGTGNNTSVNFTNTIISSSSTNSISNAPAPRTGTYAAEKRVGYGGQFYQIDNINWSDMISIINGGWQLAIDDWNIGDTGYLSNWSISITYKNPSDHTPATGTWSPITSLYKDSALLVPYTGSATNLVYAKYPTANINYNVVVQTQNCTTNTTVIPVIKALPVTGVTTPSDITICEGADTIQFVSNAVSGTVFNYQWQVSSDNGGVYSNIVDNGVNYFGANTNILKIVGYNGGFDGNKYRMIIEACGDSIYSDPGTLNVYANPNVKILFDNATPICSAQPVLLHSSLNNVRNAYDGIYQLIFNNYDPYYNPNYDGGSTKVELRTTGANSVKIYTPLFSGYYNPAILNGNLSAFTLQEPEYKIDPVTKKITVQNSSQFAGVSYEMAPNYDSYFDPADNSLFAKWGYDYVNGIFEPNNTSEWTQQFIYLKPRPTYQYQWKFNGVNITGATDSVYLATIPGLYTLSITTSEGCSFTSAALDTKIHKEITANGSTLLCNGSSVNISVSSLGNTYQWFKNDTAISGANDYVYAVSEPGIYYATFNDNLYGCGVVSDSIAIGTIFALSNSPVMTGDNIILSASSIPNATYSWTGPNGYNAYTQNPVISNAQLSMSGTYSVTANISGCSTLTYNIDVAVISPTKTYTFTGNGNWSLATNWASFLKPPASLPSGSQIIINPTSNGECILNVTQTISQGASIKVLTGKKFRVPGNLIVQ